MFIVLIFANFLFFFVIEQVLLYSIRLLELSFLFHRVGAIVIEELVTRLVELELLSRWFFFISCIFVFFASGHVRDVSSVELTGFCWSIWSICQRWLLLLISWSRCRSFSSGATERSRSDIFLTNSLKLCLRRRSGLILFASVKCSDEIVWINVCIRISRDIMIICRRSSLSDSKTILCYPSEALAFICYACFRWSPLRCCLLALCARTHDDIIPPRTHLPSMKLASHQVSVDRLWYILCNRLKKPHQELISMIQRRLLYLLVYQP